MRGHDLDELAKRLAAELHGTVGEELELQAGMGASRRTERAIIVNAGVGIPLRIWETDDSLSWRSRTTRHFDIRIVWPRLQDGTEITMDHVMTEDEKAPHTKQPQYRPGLPIRCKVTEFIPILIERIRSELFDGAGRFYVRAVIRCAAAGALKPPPPSLQLVKS